jgi:hypothetical protein
VPCATPAREPIDAFYRSESVGLCPGPTIASLAAFSARIVAVVVAMARAIFLAPAAGGCGGLGAQCLFSEILIRAQKPVAEDAKGTAGEKFSSPPANHEKRLLFR